MWQVRKYQFPSRLSRTRTRTFGREALLEIFGATSKSFNEPLWTLRRIWSGDKILM
jgi:hypothetical protein